MRGDTDNFFLLLISVSWSVSQIHNQKVFSKVFTVDLQVSQFVGQRVSVDLSIGGSDVLQPVYQWSARLTDVLR